MSAPPLRAIVHSIWVNLRGIVADQLLSWAFWAAHPEDDLRGVIAAAMVQSFKERTR